MSYPVSVDGKGRETAPPELHIAVLTQHFPPEYTGAGIQLVRLIESLQGRGVAIDVLAPAPPEPQEGSDPRGDRVRVWRFAAPRRRLARELVLGLRAAIWLLVHSRWDVLHLIDFSYFTMLPLLVARLRRRPTLVKTTLFARSPTPSPGALLLGRVRGFGYRSSDVVVALSEALEEQLRDEYRVSSGILRIPNGVDMELFRPVSDEGRVAQRRELGLPERAFVVVTCGMLTARKNALALVEAAARLRHRPVRLILAGPPGWEGDYTEQLDRAIRALPDGVEAERPGDLEASRIAELLRSADVYTLTSRAEGLPNSLLEAMASGIPSVATDIPGCCDLLAQGGGILVPLDDLDALAAALDRLAANPGECRALGADGHRLVESQYSMKNVAERYLETYQQLTGSSRAAPPGP